MWLGFTSTSQNDKRHQRRASDISRRRSDTKKAGRLAGGMIDLRVCPSQRCKERRPETSLEDLRHTF